MAHGIQAMSIGFLVDTDTPIGMARPDGNGGFRAVIT